MKKSIRIMALVCLLMAQTAAYAGHDKPVAVEQLPQAAQQILKKHFPTRKVALAKMEYEWFGKSYDVIFTNGDKVEFDGSGKWTELECKHSQVPSALIPAAIMKNVKAHYPQATVLEISRDRKGYEVKLSNRIELEFNHKFQLTDIDN